MSVGLILRHPWGLAVFGWPCSCFGSDRILCSHKMIRASAVSRFMNNKRPENYSTSVGPASVDVSVKGIVGSLAALILLGVLLHFALLRLEAVFQRNRPRTGQSMTAYHDVASSFAAPQLQLAPRDDLRAFRAREDQLLNSYGWIDKTAGVARNPIS